MTSARICPDLQRPAIGRPTVCSDDDTLDRGSRTSNHQREDPRWSHLEYKWSCRETWSLASVKLREKHSQKARTMMAQNVGLAAIARGSPEVPSSPRPTPSETQHKTCREEKALEEELTGSPLPAQSGWRGLLRGGRESSRLSSPDLTWVPHLQIQYIPEEMDRR